MNIIAICGFCIVSACIIATVRVIRPELASVATAVVGVLVMAYVVESLSPFVSFMREIASEQGIESYFSLMLKALAISFCSKISSEICRDCGENTLATRIEFVGKAGIILISLPIVKQLFSIAKDMLG